MNLINYLKNGGINIKKENKGKFTEYCDGKVTEKCIEKGKNSPNKTIRKQAIFAENARVWKHQGGGPVWEDRGKKIEYKGSGYINTKGDTIREFHPVDLVKPKQLYEVRYTNKPGLMNPTLTTRQESGELVPGPRYVISGTSTLGQALNDTFYDASRQLPIKEDYSKKPWYSKWFYRLLGFQKGGTLNYKNYL